MKILIIEDDRKLREELALFFQIHGYETEEITDYSKAAERTAEAAGQLLLLDLNLPQADGKYICKEVRKNLSLPVIIITSQNTEMNELLCLNYGADDFVAKPFNPQILLAHVEAVLKRTYKESREIQDISCGEFLFCVSRGSVAAGDREAELTKNEGKILYYLAKHRGEILSRDALISYLWDSEWFVDDNTLTVNINRLRGKLESIGITGVIHTKRGQGYMLV